VPSVCSVSSVFALGPFRAFALFALSRLKEFHPFRVVDAQVERKGNLLDPLGDECRTRCLELPAWPQEIAMVAFQAVARLGNVEPGPAEPMSGRPGDAKGR
jgi:hypothetical protein